MRGNARVNWFHTDKIYDSEANASWLAPADRVNLCIGVHKPHYSVELYGTNIFNNLVPTSLARASDSFTGGQAISVSLPDKGNFGIRISTKF